ncbi:MAG: DUF1569 domain-containing protein [Bacteroidota bacterium]
MKTIFDKATTEEVINRINTLDDNSKAQWGKMDVYQMLKHCTLWEDMMQSKQNLKRPLISYIFGKMALKAVLKDESPLRRSTPTIPELVITNKGDVAFQKAEWIARIRQYEYFSNAHFVHVFFGRMTQEQIGYMVYKHMDHHLRQFNA